jgi:thiosulfate/3-mercaptopyruvate sulfurtransferase
LEESGMTGGYARPELLAEPEWLAENGNDPTVRIIDCGGADAYDRAHIPGAVCLLGEAAEPLIAKGVWLKDPADPLYVINPDGMTAVMGALGVSDDTTVVAYDSYNGTWATRLWWVLAYYGHSNVKVLNGGWQRWVDEARPVTFRATTPPPGTFTPRPNESLRVKVDELLARYADPALQVVNALWPDWYAGTVNEYGTKRVGHIPGSINVPVERLLADDDVPTLKPAAELRSVLTEAGLSPERETIVHCFGAVRTTMDVFAMYLLGWDRVRAYDGSMAEWQNRDDTPLEV